ncbi:MAG: hypothetical protein NT029_13865 [Armatimonadetes bacterium]|nr:hypothetical protein [Armatimonadota bacterium]
MRRFGWGALVSVWLAGLWGCGGGARSVAPPAPAARGAARFDVDVKTGKVTVSNAATGRAVYTGSAVSFTSSDLLSVGGDAGKRLIRVQAVNASGETWGSSPVNLVVSGIETADTARVRANTRVTTLAGSGVSGLADGYRTAAQFRAPSAIALGQGPNAGAIFVPDQDRHVIRRIEADGMVSTIAGAAGTAGSADGVGAAATFNFPTGVATDSNGNIFVADQSGCRVRRITPQYEVTTIAGTGVIGSLDGTGDTATLGSPTGVACSPDGNRI